MNERMRTITIWTRDIIDRRLAKTRTVTFYLDPQNQNLYPESLLTDDEKQRFIIARTVTYTRKGMLFPEWERGTVRKLHVYQESTAHLPKKM